MKLILNRLLWLTIGTISMLGLAFFRSFRDTNILTVLTIICSFLLGILVNKKGKKNLLVFFAPFFIEYIYFFYLVPFSNSAKLIYILYEIFIILSPFFISFYFGSLHLPLKIGLPFLLLLTVYYFLFTYLPKENYQNFSNSFKTPVYHSFDTVKLLDKDSNIVYISNSKKLITLIDISFIGCKPCKDKFGPLTQLSEKTKSKSDLQIIRVIDGRIDNYKTYHDYYFGKDKKQTNFPIYYDPN